MDSKKIGKKMREIREARGMTTTEMAKRLELSQAQVSRLENGVQGFRSATLGRICDVLGVEPITLLATSKAGEAAALLDAAPGFRRFVENAAKLNAMAPAHFKAVDILIQSLLQKGS